MSYEVFDLLKSLIFKKTNNREVFELQAFFVHRVQISLLIFCDIQVSDLYKPRIVGQ